MVSNSAAALRDLPLPVAVSIGFGLAHIGTSAMPFQIGALVDGSHRSASEAGLFGFLEGAALAAGMIFIAMWIDRVPPRRIALIGVVFAGSANGGLFVCHSFYAQNALAVLAGIGYGLVFAATIAS